LFGRYGGVPVDFEVVQMDPKSESNEDLEYALTSIRRNGVAIKGNLIQVMSFKQNAEVVPKIALPHPYLFIVHICPTISSPV
jgi:hypothetical protein